MRIFLLALVFILNTSCTLITEFESFRLDPVEKTTKSELESNILVHLWLKNSGVNSKTVFPLVFSRSISKGPYQIVLTISGSFDSLEDTHIEYSVNNNKGIVLDYSKEDWKIIHKENGKKRYVLNNLYLDYPWNEIEAVRFKIQLDVVKDNVRYEFIETQTFKPQYRKDTGSMFVE